MRPKLKSDTFFIPVDEGVYVRTNEKSFTIKGKTLAAWLERLAPVLDGRHDLQELCQALPEGRRQVIERLILQLAGQGCIKDCSSELPHTLSPALIETYGPAITFIDYHTDSGAARFERFLGIPVLAIGSGEPLLALAHALLETGNREISLLDTGEARTNDARLQEILQVLREQRDSALRLNQRSPQIWQDERELHRLCASTGMVLYFASTDRLSSVDRLNTLCRQAQVPFLPALIRDDAIEIGPLCVPDRPACWQCLWRRRRAAQGLPAYSVDGQVLGTAEQERRYPGKPAIGVTANILAEAFFTYGTQVEWNTLHESYLILELQHLQNIKHPLFAHPLCTVCSEYPGAADPSRTVTREITHLMRSEDLSQEDLRERMEAWTDEEGGLFSRIEYADYHQLPLTRCQVSVPLACDIPCPLPRVQACALDYPAAYTDAGRLAVAAYVESLADARRACRGTYAQYSDRAVRPERLFGWRADPSASTRALAWTWGVKLRLNPTADQPFEPVLLPGAAVAPRSAWNLRDGEPLFHHQIPGTGVGTTWHATLADTLLRLYAALYAPAHESRSTIAEALYREDGECCAYHDILQILDARICLVDCTDPFGLPCIGAYLDGAWLGSFSHWHTLSAIRAALKQAVLSRQLQRTPGPNDAPNEGVAEAIVPAYQPAAPLTRLSPREALMPSLAAETDAAGAATALRALFERRAWEIVAALPPVDQTASSVWPCQLRVLALRKESEERE